MAEGADRTNKAFNSAKRLTAATDAAHTVGPPSDMASPLRGNAGNHAPRRQKSLRRLLPPILAATYAKGMALPILIYFTLPRSVSTMPLEQEIAKGRHDVPPPQ